MMITAIQGDSLIYREGDMQVKPLFAAIAILSLLTLYHQTTCSEWVEK